MSTDLLVMTLNEIDGMKQIMSKIKKDWIERILIVDGGSTDGTIEEAKRMGFELIQQKYSGYGGAILTGVEYTNSENIMLFSPDGNHDVSDIPKLIKKIEEGFDQVVVTRFGKTSINLDAGFVDTFGNKMFVFLVNILFGGHWSDTLTGHRIITRKAMLELSLSDLGMDSTQQMSIRGLKKNQKITEIEGNEWERVGGQRKMEPLKTGAALSIQIIKEFIFWKF